MTKIILNGDLKEVKDKFLTYKKIAELVNRTNPTITYQHTNGIGATLKPSEAVAVMPGLIINAVNTGNA